MTETDDASESKRLYILEPDEIEALYAQPRFTSDEQQLSFTLSPAERTALLAFRLPPSQRAFILQLGYFKAKRLFFPVTFADVPEDIDAILARHFPQASAVGLVPPSKPTILKQRSAILDLCQYRLCQADERRQLMLRARQAAQLSAKPVYIFRELLQLLTEQRFVLPGYTVMQELIGKALSYEQHRLTGILQAALTVDDRATLERLLTADSAGSYPLTQLKREPADFAQTAMRQEAARAETLSPLATLATQVLPRLAISPEGIA